MIGRVTFVVLAVAAVVGAVVWQTGDDSETRLWGGVVAFLGAVVAHRVLTNVVLTRDGGPGTIVLDEADGTPGFVFRLSRAKHTASLVLVAVGLVAVVNGARSGIAWLWVIAAGLAALLVLSLIRIRKLGVLRVTPTHVGPLHWDQVQAIFVQAIPVQPRNRYVRLQATYGDDVDLNMGILVAGPEFVAATLNAYLEDPDRRMRIGTEAELERITR